MSNSQQQYLRAKNRRIRYLLIISLIFIVGLAVLVGVYFSKLKGEIVVISILVLTILLVCVLYFKPKIMYYSYMQIYFKLLNKSEKKYKIKEDFSSGWFRKLIDIGFNLSLGNDEVDILYRVVKPNEKKLSNSNNVLEIITILKNEKSKLYSDYLDSEYKKIWMENQNKKQISKQVIIQFKKYYKVYDANIKDELDQIISYKEKRNYLVTINCGYFPNDNNSFYFLHSNDYYPNRYYKHGCDLIKEIVK